jgi:phosphoglycolate phosphatase
MTFTPQHAYDLWIFDLDGTLIDSRLDLVSAVNATLTWRGLPPLPEDTIVSYIGDGAEDLIRRSLAAAGATPAAIGDDFAGTMRWFLDHYGEHCLDRTVLYPGARALLEALAARDLPMALLTNKPEKPTLKILEHLDILRHFGQVVPGDGPLGKKPDPTGLTAILKAMNTVPERAVLVGDSLQDLEAAQAAGTAMIAFRGGLGDAAALAARHPTAMIDTLSELHACVTAPEARR